MTMPVFGRKLGQAISPDAQERIRALRPYPTLDMWRNPITRDFARRSQNKELAKSLGELDFEYRMSEAHAGAIAGVHYETDNKRADPPVFLFIHGGGFVSGDARSCAATALAACYVTGADGFGPNCPLLPEAPFPAQIDHVSEAYDALCDHYESNRIIILAESTGVAIALSAMMRWRAEQRARPGAAILLTPSIDGAAASDTQITLQRHDPLTVSECGRTTRNQYAFYAPGYDLNDATVSPIYGDFKDLCPMLIQSGSRDVFLGDAARLDCAARRAGVSSRLQVFDGMYHRFHANWSLAEAKEAHRDIADFITAL